MKKRRRTSVQRELLDAIRETAAAISDAEARFSQLTDPTLIDACIYEVNYLRLHHAYLIRLARQYAEAAEFDTAPVSVELPHPIRTAPAGL